MKTEAGSILEKLLAVVFFIHKVLTAIPASARNPSLVSAGCRAKLSKNIKVKELAKTLKGEQPYGEEEVDSQEETETL